jgi:hypothetical protein
MEVSPKTMNPVAQMFALDLVGQAVIQTRRDGERADATRFIVSLDPQQTRKPFDAL